MRVLLAGGGTAGHVEPALNTADELKRTDPHIDIIALGTSAGLEATLVPARGYELVEVPAAPLPRKVNADLFATPMRLRRSIAATRQIIKTHDIDVVVGFGGYVAMPAYFAARGRAPVVIHEANAKAGIANKIGARWASAVAQAVPDSIPDAVTIGVPLRRTIAELDRQAVRNEARSYFNLPADAPCLLVFGGSLGARRINDALNAALPSLLEQGFSVLHLAGRKNDDQVVAELPIGSGYVRLPYCDRMDLAYAAADLAVCRAGAMTCAEVATVGLPAVYVPLPIGNGEQRLNAQPTVTAGGGVFLFDEDLSGMNVANTASRLLSNPAQLLTMGAAASTVSSRGAASMLAEMVIAAADEERTKRAR